MLKPTTAALYALHPQEDVTVLLTEYPRIPTVVLRMLLHMMTGVRSLMIDCNKHSEIRNLPNSIALEEMFLGLMITATQDKAIPKDMDMIQQECQKRKQKLLTGTTEDDLVHIVPQETASHI